MNWIPVGESVPNDRRRVITWGVYRYFGRDMEPGFIGDTKYNPSRDGRGKFDNEVLGTYGSVRVTHWAEIVPPVVLRGTNDGDMPTVRPAR